MGFFNISKGIADLFKKTTTIADDDLSAAEKALLAEISKINARNGNITNDLYQQLRAFEMDWLERHYDFNTLEGVKSIPVTSNLRRAPAPQGPMQSHTGEVYYYLRYKAYNYEKTGDIDLALACMRKSVALVKCRSFFSTDDILPLVKMLARMGNVDEAYAELRSIEQYTSEPLDCEKEIEAEIRRGKELKDFQWVQANIPDKCPKSISSYRRMKTQNTKNYQFLKQAAAKLGRDI